VGADIVMESITLMVTPVDPSEFAR